VFPQQSYCFFRRAQEVMDKMPKIIGKVEVGKKIGCIVDPVTGERKKSYWDPRKEKLED